MSDLFSNYKPKYDDDVMECLQFGICSSRSAPSKEIPYFHFWNTIKTIEISDLFSNYKPKYDDDVMECLQFGICSPRPVPSREIPYFHF